MIKIIKEWPLHYVWVPNYYDYPLHGTCLLDDELCMFRVIESDHGTTLEYDVYPLSWKDKMKWKTRQWIFEFCVGTHCTYNGPGRTSYYTKRRPEWFWSRLFNAYYKIKRSTKKT